jgi:hypothetical protein
LRERHLTTWENDYRTAPAATVWDTEPEGAALALEREVRR